MAGLRCWSGTRRCRTRSPGGVQRRLTAVPLFVGGPDDADLLVVVGEGELEPVAYHQELVQGRPLRLRAGSPGRRVHRRNGTAGRPYRRSRRCRCVPRHGPRSGGRRRPVGRGHDLRTGRREERPGPGSGSGGAAVPGRRRCGAGARRPVGWWASHAGTCGHWDPPTRRAAPRGANSHLAPRTTKPRRTEPSSRRGLPYARSTPPGGSFPLQRRRSQRSLGEGLRRRRRPDAHGSLVRAPQRMPLEQRSPAGTDQDTGPDEAIDRVRGHPRPYTTTAGHRAGGRAAALSAVVGGRGRLPAPARGQEVRFSIQVLGLKLGTAE